MKGNLFRKKSVSDILAETARLDAAEHPSSLRKTLTARDLTAFGIAAIVGAGIFSTIGNAAAAGGPAVALLFVFTAIACAFSALCYAEFASMVPVSGSAYTYSYVAFGEMIAWIIGWDLILEYAIGNIAVAISWSDYFTGLVQGLGWYIPEYLTMDFLTAKNGYEETHKLISSSGGVVPPNLDAAYTAWTSAPRIGNIPIVLDIPALAIVFLITWLVYVGIKESRTASNIMVALKLIVIIAVIVIGASYVSPENWSPFMPHGLGGVLQGVAAVFFAYIGFDAISTTAEETRNPRRDMPRGIFYSLLICTVLYVLIALVLTGMVPYDQLGVGDPLAFVFKRVGLDFISGVVAFTAIIAIASVLLVFQMGQPRILMSMSRDGLLPKPFARIHPKFRTPSFSTVVTGFVVAIPALFMNLEELTELTSIGTLFAFVLVCGGVLVLQNSSNAQYRKFKVFYINSRYIMPVLFLLGLVTAIWAYGQEFYRLEEYDKTDRYGWDMVLQNMSFVYFMLGALVMTILSFIYRLSLIPVLGLLSCFYLMTELDLSNWVRFLVWLAIGIVIYFIYGYKKSRLAPNQTS